MDGVYVGIGQNFLHISFIYKNSALSADKHVYRKVHNILVSITQGILVLVHWFVPVISDKLCLASQRASP